MTQTTFNAGRLLLGLILVVLGVLFLFDQVGILNAGSAIDHWWPLAIVAIGVIQLMVAPREYVGPGIIILIGIVLLGETLDIYSVNVWAIIWPSLIVLIGLSVLLGRNRWLGSSRRSSSEDRVHGLSLFGGADVLSHSSRFTGADVLAFFGGSTLDLRQARPAPEGAIVDVTAAFGGVDILVPHGWDVRMSGIPIFGAFENKTADGELPPDAPRLTVRGMVVFGGVSVKHDK